MKRKRWPDEAPFFKITTQGCCHGLIVEGSISKWSPKDSLDVYPTCQYCREPWLFNDLEPLTPTARAMMEIARSHK